MLLSTKKEAFHIGGFSVDYNHKSNIKSFRQFVQRYGSNDAANNVIFYLLEVKKMFTEDFCKLNCPNSTMPSLVDF